MLQKVEIAQVCTGMYVTRVLKQKGNIKLASRGRIRGEEEISKLAGKGILQVEIDLTKSTHLPPVESEPQSEDPYRNAAGLSYSEQLSRTLELYDQAKNIHSRIITNISKGKAANIQEVEGISAKIVDTVFECEDAVAVVTLLKKDHEYLLEHSINCAILIIMLGKQLDLPRKDLHDLGTGALLMDVGMTTLPLLLTEKPGPLPPKEAKKMQRHVDFALSLSENISSVSEVSLAVIGQHHERLDGSGYPGALKGEQISLYGRMAAIVDTYDSLTTERSYRKALNPSDALINMSKEGLGLDEKLIGEFILCIGVNPVGSVVRLDSDKLAMVIRINPDLPLRPVVMVFYDLSSKSKETIQQVDLAQTNDKIISSIPPSEFNLELGMFLKQAFSPDK